MEDPDVQRYIEEARRTSPRTTNLLPVFAQIALGRAGRPDIADAIPDPRLLCDIETLAFAVYLQNYTGIFHRHLNASVPFFAEEQCRLGLVISRYSLAHSERAGRSTRFWSFGSAEAPMARAAARYANGSLLVHCSSENTENFEDLRARPEQHVSIEVGPFYDLCHQEFEQMVSSSSSSDGGETKYDIIFEHTCFQMHHPDRLVPLRILRDRLDENGILLIYEKLLDTNNEAYWEREAEKDIGFKSRYFSDREIASKKSDILTYMEKCQVHLSTLVEAIKPVARYVYMIWRSGNFVGIAASNSAKALMEFLTLLPGPFVENVAYQNDLPLKLGDALDPPPSFRPHERDLLTLTRKRKVDRVMLTS